MSDARPRNAKQLLQKGQSQQNQSAAAERTAGATAKGDNSCGSEGKSRHTVRERRVAQKNDVQNVVHEKDTVTSWPQSLLHTEREETLGNMFLVISGPRPKTQSCTLKGCQQFLAHFRPRATFL